MFYLILFIIFKLSFNLPSRNNTVVGSLIFSIWTVGKVITHSVSKPGSKSILSIFSTACIMIFVLKSGPIFAITPLCLIKWLDFNLNKLNFNRQKIQKMFKLCFLNFQQTWSASVVVSLSLF